MSTTNMIQLIDKIKSIPEQDQQAINFIKDILQKHYEIIDFDYLWSIHNYLFVLKLTQLASISIYDLKALLPDEIVKNIKITRVMHICFENVSETWVYLWVEI